MNIKNIQFNNYNNKHLLGRMHHNSRLKLIFIIDQDKTKYKQQIPHLPSLGFLLFPLKHSEEDAGPDGSQV